MTFMTSAFFGNLHKVFLVNMDRTFRAKMYPDIFQQLKTFKVAAIASPPDQAKQDLLKFIDQNQLPFQYDCTGFDLAMACDVYQMVDNSVGSIQRKETERNAGAGTLKLTLIKATS